MWVSYEALCEMGAVDIDPTSVFGVRPDEIDKLQLQQNKQHNTTSSSKGESMPLQEKPLHMTPHHQFTPPMTMGAMGIGSARPMEVVGTPTSIGPKASLFQTVQRPSNKSGVDPGGGGAILPNQLQFDTPNLTPIPMQQDVSYVHPNSAVSMHGSREVPTTDRFVDSRNPNTVRRAKHVAARLYYQPTPETPQYSELMTAAASNREEESRFHRKTSTAGAGAGSSSRRYLRGKSALWSTSILESSTISETPVRRGGGRPSDISTTRRPRALFLSENRNGRQNMHGGTNGDADADHDDQLHVEDEENYRHRGINNGRPPLGQHDGEGVDDSEQPNIMMMTEESGGRLFNEKTPSGIVAADNGASNQEITQALEEDAMMEKHDGSIQNILELLCLMGAGYWRLCQVRNIFQYIWNCSLSLQNGSSIFLVTSPSFFVLFI